MSCSLSLYCSISCSLSSYCSLSCSSSSYCSISPFWYEYCFASPSLYTFASPYCFKYFSLSLSCSSSLYCTPPSIESFLSSVLLSTLSTNPMQLPNTEEVIDLRISSTLAGIKSLPDKVDKVDSGVFLLIFGSLPILLSKNL